MGVFNKLISALKTEDSNIKAKTAPFDEDGNPIKNGEKREEKRYNAKSEFCIFIAKHNEPLDTEKAPFLLADLNNISIKGAAFSCVSKTACSPFSPDIEEQLQISSQIWLVANIKISEKTCCSPTACSCENETENQFGSEPLKATILWVKPNQFGCTFKCEKEKVEKLIETIDKYE